MTTIDSSFARVLIHNATESPMRPMYSTEKLYGVATQLNSSGAEVPFVGTATLWIRNPSGVTAQNSVTCTSPNGAWSYLNSNSIAGTWTATLHVPASTGKLADASPDYQWEVSPTVATAQ